MDTRPVQYLEHTPKDAALAAEFVTLECVPEGGLHHAVTVPRAWARVTPLGLDPDPRAPLLASLIVEDLNLGDDTAVVVCGTLPLGWAADAKAVVEGLAAREELAPYRWNDEDDAVGGARAMITDGKRVGAIRVLPLATEATAGIPGWVFVSCIGPGARLAEFGGALKNAIASFRVHPFAKFLNA